VLISICMTNKLSLHIKATLGEYQRFINFVEWADKE
jgi:hypothetical protein